MQANPPGVELLGTTFKFTFSIRREIRHFHVVVAEKRANKRDVVVLHIKSIVFLYVLVVVGVVGS